jgi:hypothetical protein
LNDAMFTGALAVLNLRCCTDGRYLLPAAQLLSDRIWRRWPAAAGDQIPGAGSARGLLVPPGMAARRTR